MATNIRIVATVFPTIALVLGVLVVLAGRVEGWLLILLGAVFQLLWLGSRR